MGTICIYPVGNSDIKSSGNKGNYRDFTKELSEVIKKGVPDSLSLSTGGFFYKGEKIELPIFSSLLNFLKTNREKDVVFLFVVTDQQNVAPELSSKDTIYAWYLLAYYLERKGQAILEKVKEPLIVSKDPTDILEITELMREFTDKNFAEFNEYGNIYVILGPGTPAINYSLILSFSRFDKVHFYYAKEKKTEKFPTEFVEVKLKSYFEKLFIKRTLKDMISSFDYISAATFIRKSIELHPEFAELMHLCEALSNRMNFEFEKALISLDKHISLSKNNEDLIKDLKERLSKLKSKDEKARIEELYLQFGLRIRANRFLEAVAMIFRIEEELLKMEVEKEFKLKIEKGKEGFKEFKYFIDNKIELKTFLEKKKINYEEPTRVVLKSILEFPHFKDKHVEVLEFCNTLEERQNSSELSILELRNLSPFAHGFEGAGSEKITELTGWVPDTIVDRVRDILGKLSISVPKLNDKNFEFLKINNFIIDKLK